MIITNDLGIAAGCFRYDSVTDENGLRGIHIVDLEKITAEGVKRLLVFYNELFSHHSVFSPIFKLEVSLYRIILNKKIIISISNFLTDFLNLYRNLNLNQRTNSS